MEHRLNGEKLSNEFNKILKSKGKVVLPVFVRDQIVKVAFPDEPIRYGKVKSTKDMAHKTAVRISFNNKKAVGVNKNFICLPRSGAAVTLPPEVPDSANIDSDIGLVPTTENTSPVIEVELAPEIPVSTPVLPIIQETEVPDARAQRGLRRENKNNG